MSTLVRWRAPAPTAASPRTRLASGARSCGRSVLVRAPRLQGRRRTVVLWGGGAVALVVLVVVVAIVLNAKSDRDARQRAADARAVAAERVRLTKLQAPHRGAAPALRPAAGRDRPGAPRGPRRAREDGRGRHHARRAGARPRGRDRRADPRKPVRPVPPRPRRGPGRPCPVQAGRPLRLRRRAQRHQGRLRLLGREHRLPVRRRARLPPLHLRVVPQHAGAERARARRSRSSASTAPASLRGARPSARATWTSRARSPAADASAVLAPRGLRGLGLRPRLLLAALLVPVRRLRRVGDRARRGGSWPPARASR